MEVVHAEAVERLREENKRLFAAAASAEKALAEEREQSRGVIDALREQVEDMHTAQEHALSIGGGLRGLSRQLMYYESLKRGGTREGRPRRSPTLGIACGLGDLPPWGLHAEPHHSRSSLSSPRGRALRRGICWACVSACVTCARGRSRAGETWLLFGLIPLASYRVC